MSRPAAWTTDFRYHSSWVLAQNGIATSLPFQVEPWIALSTTPWLTRCATSAGTGARKPACANSGMYGGVQAHDVDRRVTGREAPHELLALGRRVPRQLGRGEGVAATGGLGAPLGDLRLPARVGVDVPGEGRRAAGRAAAGSQGGGQDECGRGTHQAATTPVSCSRTTDLPLLGHSDSGSLWHGHRLRRR